LTEAREEERFKTVVRGGVSDWPAEDDRVELGSVDVPGLSVLVVDHVRRHAGHRRLVDRCAVVRRLDDRSTRP